MHRKSLRCQPRRWSRTLAEKSNPRRLATPAKVVIGVLAIGVVVNIIGLIAEQDYLSVLNKLADGVDITYDQATAVDSHRSSAGIAEAIASIAAAIAFVVWFRRAYRNLPALGAGTLRYAPGWAVGGWFVPILGLWRPKQIANDIWRASDPAISDGNDPADWRGRKISAVVGWWWALFVIAGWVGNASTRLFFRAETLREQQSAAHLEIGSDVMTIVAAIVAILFVRRLTARQDTRIERLKARAPERELPSLPFTDE